MVLVVLMVFNFYGFFGFHGFSSPQFSPFVSMFMWMGSKEGGGTCIESLMFINCGNSIPLNIVLISEPLIWYFKCPNSLHRIEKMTYRKIRLDHTLDELEKQMLPCGSHHQAQQ